MKKFTGFFLLACLALTISAHAIKTANHRGVAKKTMKEVSLTLDSLHRYASEAKGSAYFELFDKKAIFLGTDASERWSKQQFKDYAFPHFNKGKGWTYNIRERHIYFSDDRKTAWFDERLNNKKLGECRGSGVLILTESGWKISQYNLTIPVPNSLAAEFAEKIKKTSGS